MVIAIAAIAPKAEIAGISRIVTTIIVGRSAGQVEAEAAVEVLRGDAEGMTILVAVVAMNRPTTVKTTTIAVEAGIVAGAEATSPTGHVTMERGIVIIGIASVTMRIRIVTVPAAMAEIDAIMEAAEKSGREVEVEAAVVAATVAQAVALTVDEAEVLITIGIMTSTDAGLKNGHVIASVLGATDTDIVIALDHLVLGPIQSLVDHIRRLTIAARAAQVLAAAVAAEVSTMDLIQAFGMIPTERRSAIGQRHDHAPSRPFQRMS